MFSIDTIHKNIRYKQIQAQYFPRAYETDKLRGMLNRSEIICDEEIIAKEVLNYPFSTLSTDDIKEIMYKEFTSKPSLIGRIIAGLSMREFEFKIKQLIMK